MHPLLHRLSHLSSRGRFTLATLLAIAAGMASGLLQPPGLRQAPETPWLLGWCVFCATLLASHLYLMATLDATGMRQRVRREDPGAPLLAIVVIVASCASLGAVALAVDTGRALHGIARWAHIALAVASLVQAWLLMQMAFALHYAREYYQPGTEEAGSSASAGDASGGLEFPGGLPPDYLDFAYYAAVIGMTSQVSDVTATSRDMRRLTLVHGLLSFAFNLVVLALAVNVLASLLQG